ncbi:MAG: heparinase II/III family protein [Clostridia bacterium]|nr:heparinase II/III family protein [Clostridia bacterium]
MGIYISFVLTSLLFIQNLDKLTVVIMCATFMVVTGILDDIYDIKISYKLLIEVAVALALYSFGIRAALFSPIMDDINIFTFVDIVLNILWVIGIINAINLIDGLDGLASGITIIACVAFCFIASGQNKAIVKTMALLLAASTAGFIKYNYNPALIFLGDTGSLFLGYMLAVISMLTIDTSISFVSLFTPILILSIPIFDTGVSILRRAMCKKGIFNPDKSHIHHRLIGMKLGHKKSVYIIYSLAIVFALLGIIINKTDSLFLGVVVIGLLIILGIVMGIDEIPRNHQHKIFLYINTIKYLKPIQIFYRIKLMFSKKLFILGRRNYWINENLTFFPGYTELDKKHLKLFDKYQDKADEILNNSFCFLNVKRDYSDGVDWQDKSVSKLWLYNLHYHQYIEWMGIAYRITGENKYFEKYLEIVNDWIDNNEIGHGPGWESYTLSLRIVSWIKCYHLFNVLLKERCHFKQKMLGSLFEQASFLFRNIEYHLLANHLFENIKALIFAGMFFECSSSKRWYKRACRLLDRQIKEQILDDGGHFERSPMYHNIVMGGLIELVQLFRLNGRQYPQEIDRRLSKAVNFSLNMLHPDREIPLFNDSALSKELLSIELIQAGSALYCDGDTKDISGVYSTFVFLIFGDRGKEICNSIYIPAYDDSIKHFKQSGFYIINQRDLNAKLFIDCGSTCPEYNPGHTHCNDPFGLMFLTSSYFF